ncbi:MAG: MBL fold metallo-hydrolase [Pseudomonadota bacterium]|nr:MBL fold metallo-hydrolase [Pseudomonadota bacterium]
MRSWILTAAEQIRRWKIGNVGVTRISEGVLLSTLVEPSAEESFLGYATGGVLRELEGMVPDFATADGAIRLAFQSYVVDTGDLRIVVDTCVGNDKHRSAHPFWERLALPFLTTLTDAGYPRETIDLVVCTHLHVDHVGWNTMLCDGRWLPTFPNATYLFGRTEFQHWQAAAAGKIGGAFHPDVFMADSIQPIIDAGLSRLVETNHAICDSVRLVPTPGHTPGHVSVLIRSNGAEALITGDTIHHPVQVAHPDWGVAADGDRTAARATRRALLEASADTERLLIGTHWAGRAAGRVIRVGDGFRLR